MSNDYKRIHRSKENKMLCGVCGGIGEYFNIDPTLVRIIYAILTLSSCGTGLLIYFIAAIVMPEISSTDSDIN